RRGGNLVQHGRGFTSGICPAWRIAVVGRGYFARADVRRMRRWKLGLTRSPSHSTHATTGATRSLCPRTKGRILTNFRRIGHRTGTLERRMSNGTSGNAAKNVADQTVLLDQQYVWPGDLTEIPDWVYTDETIYKREIERIFHGPTWNYVALEAEIPNP